MFHLRTKGGRHEIDFIIEHPNSTLAIETKLTPTITNNDLRHRHWLRTQLPHHNLTLAVITTGPRHTPDPSASTSSPSHSSHHDISEGENDRLNMLSSRQRILPARDQPLGAEVVGASSGQIARYPVTSRLGRTVRLRLL